MKNLLAFTMAGGGQAAPIFGLIARRIAFTMAEILLSLTIIGVVAAITLPSLTGNINERTWNTQRKALYSRLSQAVALLPQVRGYGSFETSENEYGEEVRTAPDGGEAFLSAGLSKVLKINNICDKDHLGDCGLPETILRLGGGKVSVQDYKMLSDFNPAATTACGTGNLSVDTGAAAFETANGESLLVYYNPICTHKNQRRDTVSITASMCANFIYDLNGKKGPNTVGKDIGFMTLFYSSDSILVAPVPLSSDVSGGNNVTIDVAKQGCRAQEARLPNNEELMAMYMNQIFLDDGFVASSDYWSGTISTDVHSNQTFPGRLYGNGAELYLTGGWSGYSFRARCVKQFQ